MHQISKALTFKGLTRAMTQELQCCMATLTSTGLREHVMRGRVCGGLQPTPFHRAAVVKGGLHRVVLGGYQPGPAGYRLMSH